jgi:hypothetical protein
MSDVAHLKPAKPETDPGIVALLRKLLDEAERGEILQVVVVGERTAGSSMFCEIETSIGGDFYAVVGMLEEAKRRILSIRA